MVGEDISRPLGEKFLFFGRKTQITIDPSATLHFDSGDAHLLTPKRDGNDAGNLNRLSAIFDGYLGRGNEKSCQPGETLLLVARKTDISADPSATPGCEFRVSGNLLTTDRQPEMTLGLNRLSAVADGYLRFHLGVMAGFEG